MPTQCSIQPLPPGTVVMERYQIEKHVGSGGMSHVYKARDLHLGERVVAVKQGFGLQSREGSSQEEADILIRLRHPALPTILDYRPQDEFGMSYLVMTYIEGETVQSWFDRNGRSCPASQALEFAVQLCEVLQYLHERNEVKLIYRDLKPSNVMMDAGGNLYLIDFGISRHYKEHQTRDTVAIGTVGFAAPEQYGTDQTDHRSDLYALGAFLYYLLSGGKLPPMLDECGPGHLPGIDGLFYQVIYKLLKRNPNERYQSAGELKHQLSGLDSRRSPYSNREPRSPSLFLRQRLIAFIGLHSGAGTSFLVKGLEHILKGLGVPVKTVIIQDRANISALPGLKEPVLLADLPSGYFGHPVAAEADAVVIISSSLPEAMSEQSAVDYARISQQWAEQGKQVIWLANRDLPFHGRKRWIQAMPTAPLCFVPDFPYAWIAESYWTGLTWLERSEARETFEKALFPLIESLLPEIKTNQPRKLLHPILKRIGLASN
ncbi:serine/threonine protein kinase [Paenibacillus gansuensis]|uniref:Serine/threonine protein kinase n=1 Tax=Paenibacillus gansuensis TaxID=306542 RepID=A0ABW5PAR0_9BACL